MSPTTDPPEVKRFEIDAADVRTFDDEESFTAVSVGLLVERGSYLCIATSILPPPPHRWSRHEAVLVGHVARLYKLVSALLDYTCQHRRETTFIFARLAFECIVNTLFLIKNDSADLVASYIEYSLRHEKRLRDRMRETIAARHGVVLPIEERMLRSIESSAKASGVELDDIRATSNWGSKNLFEKARDVGLEDAYLGAFAGPSHSVHGNWQDLLEYHLEADPEGYVANLQWHRPRPQLLTTLALLTVRLLETFFSSVVGRAGDVIGRKLPDLQTRVLTLAHLHEEFLASRGPTGT